MQRAMLIAGNWKMNLSRQEAIALAKAVAGFESTDGVGVAVFPPAIWLTDVAEALTGSRVALGAQNCWTADKGAFTGEIAPAMIAELASMVLVGHSERRQILGEDDTLIRTKLDAALAAGLAPILCVGETLETRSAGHAHAHVGSQLKAALADRSADELARITVAYEPIWAIGTGVAATPADAQDMSAMIRTAIDGITSGAGSAAIVLYGGSVSPGNASELLAQPDVDGALVGGASLKAADFGAIVEAARGLV